METFKAIIEYTFTPTCFLSIPPSMLKNIFRTNKQEIIALRLLTDKNEAFILSVDQNLPSKKDGTVELSMAFANKLGLKQGQNVVLEMVPSLPSCTEAYIYPSDPKYYYWIEKNISFLKDRGLLTNQIRVIWKGLTFPLLLPGSHIPIFITVGSTFFGEKEVLIAPNLLLHVVESEAEIPSKNKVNNQFSDLTGTLIKWGWSQLTQLTQISAHNISEPSLPSLKVSFTLCLRALPLRDSSDVFFSNVVFVPKWTFLQVGIDPWDLPNEFYATLSYVPFVKEGSKKESRLRDAKTSSQKKEIRSCLVKVRVMDNQKSIMGSSISPVIYVSELFCQAFQLDPSSSLLLETLKPGYTINSPKELLFHPLKKLPNKEKQLHQFQQWFLTQLSKANFFFSPGVLFKYQEIKMMLEVPPSSSQTSSSTYYILTKENFPSCQMGELKLLPEPLPPTLRVAGPDLDHLGAIEKLKKQALDAVTLLLGLSYVTSQLRGPLHALNSHLLVTGLPGTGRTSFVTALARFLGEQPLNLASMIVDCKNLQGKRAAMLGRTFMDAASELVYRQPGILILDDLDSIASIPELNPTQSDSFQYAHVANEVWHLVDVLFEMKASILIIVTAKSAHSLHPSLMATRGRHLFYQTLEITAPDLSERLEILKSQARCRHLTYASESLESLASLTEGYMAADLAILLDKAAHFALHDGRGEKKMDIQEEVTIAQHHLTQALKDYQPSHRRNQAYKSSLYKPSWEDVGGLEEVKAELEKLLIWPSKYPQLFSQSKLRPQSGILLYGPPGTGKTLLASVLANKCSLHFISIKGPELLSKYIGSSEQMIRDVFTRAQSAKPSLLFFDEFDAIAPRRGHDATGVTDRVVNQFLTQMDGVESLQGVYILAATSKPELLDPALLRPGRLDRCIYCPLPSESERLDILKCLSQRLVLAHDVDFPSIAQATEGFSGADLQSLLYSAQLEAFHSRRNVNISSSSGDGATQEVVYHCPSLMKKQCIKLTWEDDMTLYQEVMSIKENFLAEFEDSAAVSSRSTVPEPTVSKKPALTISQNHLTTVLKTMKPSVSREERDHYERIHQRMTGGKGRQSGFVPLEDLQPTRLSAA